MCVLSGFSALDFVGLGGSPLRVSQGFYTVGVMLLNPKPQALTREPLNPKP